MILILTVISLILILGLILWHIKYGKFIDDILKIPGPPHLPFIGCLLDELFLSPEQMFQADRQNALKYYPIYKQQIFHYGAISVLNPEDVELILTRTNEKSFIYDMLHSWLGKGLLTSYGKHWQTRRKILTPAFHFNILQDFVKIFNEGTLKLIDDFRRKLSDGHIDVTPLITEFTLHAITETSMGMKLSSKSASNLQYKEAVYDVGRMVTYRLIRPWLLNESIFRLTPTARKYQKTVETLHEFSSDVIRIRRDSYKSPTTKKRLAMLDLLLAAKEESSSIDDEGIREEVDTFIFEGHDTTSVAICFMLLLLANHEEVQSRIREEIVDVIGGNEPTYYDLQKLEYTDRCLKECLRLFPSVPFIARLASDDIYTSTGYKIPKGAMIHVHIYDMHRNPRIYPDPDKFDPDRFLSENVQGRHPFAFIPFSAGQRNCIGQRYAMLELKAVLCGILRKFVLKPVDKVEDVVYVTDLVLRSKHPIRIKFLERNEMEM